MTAVDVDALDKLRDELAGPMHAAGHPDWSSLTDLLLPVVDRAAALRASNGEGTT